MVYGAWALQLMWEWFLAPGFGLAVPSLFTLLGLGLATTQLMPVSTAIADRVDRAFGDFGDFESNLSPWRSPIRSFTLHLLGGAV